jgi:hypothetical protein
MSSLNGSVASREPVSVVSVRRWDKKLYFREGHSQRVKFQVFFCNSCILQHRYPTKPDS